jgi:hypothetical protein
VEIVTLQGKCPHLRIGHSFARGVCALVELGLHPKASRGAGVADEIDDGLEGPQRLAAPVLRDVTEQPMLDL